MLRKWVAICMVLVVTLCCNACSSLYELTEITNPEQYQDIWELSERRIYTSDPLYGKLLTFPDTITESNVLQLYCWYAVYFPVGTGFQIHLSIQYNEEEYAEEVGRLEDIELTASIQYNTQNFSVPAYVAVWDYIECYEYALCDEENHIINYVYLQLIANHEKLDSSVMPVDWENGSFSIYN